MKFPLATLFCVAHLATTVHGAVVTPICAVTESCEPKVINFEEFARGDYIDFDAFQDCGISNIRVKNHDGDGSERKIRIFDTEVGVGNWDVDGADPKCSTAECPSPSSCAIDAGDCGDPDLQAPFKDLITGESGLRPGMVMIYDQVWDRSGFDDYHGAQLYPPDDSAGGARFIISWSRPVTLHSIEFLDIEHHESRKSDITLFYADDDDRHRTEVLETGDGTMHTQPILHGQNIDKANIRLGGSGAISSLTYTYEDETCAPTASPTTGFLDGSKSGGGGGDPHFQPWDSPRFTFHGECDLVMLHSDMFHNDAGLDLHVRTTIQDYFSYIETASIRIGEDVLEMHSQSFILNGKEHKELPLSFGGEGSNVYKLHKEPLREGKNPEFYHYYRLELGDNTSILFKFYKQFLTIAIDGHPDDLADSTGLLGSFETGAMLSRQGEVVASAMDYGFMWQVLPEEPKLFLENRSPMLPYEKCRMPTAGRPSRRKLRGGDLALLEEANAACSSVTESDLALCVEDVMATGDLGVADLW